MEPSVLPIIATDPVKIHYCDPRLPCPAPHVVFVLGGPGAGKGTMCELAAEQLGWVHLSMGDLLRAEELAGGPNTRDIAEAINAGRLVPDAILMTLLRNHTRATG
ncbi:MAG: nucleoside monophosphate kinase [Puniceicoccaceae bacterium]|nr:MAG: nucleoside monophosphate kinase [Puniceicoccaceae bacterium]